ncbi:MAG: hypothetical protein RIR47_116 [Bacteroidota bacterium]|jgi:UDP-glucose 4-epimerase
MKNKNILITGHKGYIGSKLYSKLLSLNYNLIGIDLKDGEDISNCLPKNTNIDCVFHLAALPRVEFSVLNPSYTMKQNVLNTSILLEWSKCNNIKKIIFSSSSAVYGNNGFPNSPYGLHKLISEQELSLYNKLYGLESISLRYFNVYSEDQKYGGSYSTAICAWMEMIRQNKSLRIDGDGEQTRDFVHVDDVVDANIYCMLIEDNIGAKHFDVGTGKSVSLNYVKKIVDKYNKVEWYFEKERFGDVKHTKANIKDLLDLGWKPKISIDDGMKKCFNNKERT